MNCPSCAANMRPVGNRNHLFCDYCSRYYFPSDSADEFVPTGDSSASNCVICDDSPLVAGILDNASVRRCSKCRGMLMSNADFASMIQLRCDSMTDSVSPSLPFDQDELNREVYCPECHRQMEAHPYGGGGNAVIDSCTSCRLVWLDAGELDVIAAYRRHRIYN